MSDFITTSVAYPLHDGEFRHLSAIVRTKLLRLMARISEASYRRGVQQGVTFEQDGRIAIDLRTMRFETDLDRCPDPTGITGCVMTSLDRLHCEYAVLFDLGFTHSN